MGGLILALATAVAGWAAALIVAVLCAAVAGVLALNGRQKVAAATPPVPAQTVDSTEGDVEWIKKRATSAR